MTPICRVKGLSLSRDKRTLLSDLNFDIDSQGLTLILGANGSGKTLLQRVLQGLVTPSMGDVVWFDCPPQQRRTLLQKPVFLNRSLLQNLKFVGSRFGLHDAELRAALERVNLGQKSNQRAQSLSGGEQQRLAFARETLGTPRVLLMDEPTANLDPKSTRQIEALFMQQLMTTEAALKIVLATHDRAQIRRLTRQTDVQVLFLNDGQLVFQGPYTDFIQSDLDPVRDYLEQ